MIRHEVTVGGRTFTLGANVTPGSRGTQERQPETASVDIVSIEEGGVAVDPDAFHALLVAQCGEGWEAWWAETEDAIVMAWHASRPEEVWSTMEATIAGERGIVGELEAQLAAVLAENARLTRERDEARAAVERVREEGEATAHRLHECRNAAVAELDAVRETMAGRMTAPTLRELAAHVCGKGVALAWLCIVDGCFPVVVQGHTARAWVRDTPRYGRPVRWVPLDAEGFPCAWPVVEEPVE